MIAAPLTPIDFADVAARADLRRLVEAELGPPDRSRRFRCPFHDDSTPSLGLTPDGRRFKCWSCGAAGDALDWVGRRDGLSVVEAARRLDPTLGDPAARRPHRPAPEPSPPPPAAHESPAWQGAVETFVAESVAALWGCGGRHALDWLRARGLDDATIARSRLGFSAAESWSAPFAWPDGRPRGLFRPEGVVIPWPAPVGADPAPGPRWVGANVRRLDGDGPKYRAVAGSARGYAYPWPEILPTQVGPPALVVEGEVDALIAWQEAGHLVHALTVGGATQGPHPSALAALALCPWVLVATDRDAAGAEAAWGWLDRYPHKARRALVPVGKDVGDLHAGGGDVAGWVRAELARLGARSAP